MKINFYIKFSLLVLFFCVFLTGCLYGKCINGPCSLEHSRISKSKSYGAYYWIKPGVSDDERRQDSWDCGAAPTILAADDVIFSKDQIEKAKNSNDVDDLYPANSRLTKAWISCMKTKGYIYRNSN